MKATPATTASSLKAIGWIIALGALALPALSAERPTHTNFRKAEGSFSVIGMKVMNYQDQRLGTVRDLGIDLENGRLVEVVVAAPSGFLGLVQRTAAVPPGALAYDPVSGVIRLNMDTETFKVAPSFKMSQWAEHTESRNVAEIYRYYGEEPYFAADGKSSKSGNTATEPLGYIQRSSKLIGLTIKNLQNEPLGVVDTLLFDLASGRVSHVIVVNPGFAHTKSVIQASALEFSVARDALQMDVSIEAFKNEPRFKWVHGPKGTFRQEAFSNTAVAANDGLNTKQNVQAGIASSYTPLAQGSSFRDVDKTHRIYAAMQADASLSKTAQNVEVGTLNGQTTLRGNVNTEDGKRAIGEIAAKAGRPENVSNLLEVRLSATGGQ